MAIHRPCFEYLLNSVKCAKADRGDERTVALRFVSQAQVVQKLDSAIHRINHYPVDKYYGNQLRYPLNSDLSGGYRYPTFEQPMPDDDFFELTT